VNNGYGEHFKKLKAQKGLHGPQAPVAKMPTPADQMRTRLKEKQTRLKQARAKKRKFPLRLIVFCLLGAGIAGSGMIFHSEIDQMISKVEVNFLGEAQAQAPKAKAGADAKSADSKDGKAADAKDGATEKTAEKASEKSENSTEIDHFLKLTDRKKALDLREEELNRLEAELQKQREEIEKKLKTLEDTRTGISTVLQERAVKDSEKVDTLVQMYSNMKPSQAAKVLESMDEDLAVEIVGRMKKKNAAEVMNLMKSEKAQVFSEKYAGYRKR
jgi:flagellar motility protein MotE (MotC chaperone)